MNFLEADVNFGEGHTPKFIGSQLVKERQNKNDKMTY